MQQRIFNISVDDISLDDLLCRFTSGMLVTPNVDHLILLQHNEAFYDAYQKADFVTVDSQIVFWALKLLGRGVKEKISGSDFLPAFCDHLALMNFRNPQTVASVFLLGGRQGVALEAMNRINSRVKSNLVIAAHSPSMNFGNDPAESSAVVEMVNNSGATALVVGLGAPKQEIWIANHRHLMPNVKQFLAVGASIDFEANVLARSPRWMSRFGLEWLFRLYKEPKRLWRRYLVRDPQFFWLVFKDRLSLYKNPIQGSQE
jgi:N-acetylglucosaminyldiphosphoundecaprenol N-acetyl-beta-D-mannosaminyltransferase